MFAILMSLGMLITIVGCAAVGFGIPNNGFDVGNTLIIAGTTAVCGGVVIIGLAACMRELRRISNALPSRLDARLLHGAEAATEAAGGPRAATSPRMPYPAMPDEEEESVREPWPLEPRMAPVPESAPVQEPIFGRPRPNVFPMSRASAAQPVVDEPEDVPLAPSRGAAAPLGRTAPPSIEAPYEPKYGPADILARLGNQGRAAANADPTRPPPANERPPEWPAAAEPPPGPPPPFAKERPRGPAFDPVWPSGGRPPGRAAGPDMMSRVSRSEGAPEPNEPFEPPPLRNEPPHLRSEPPMSGDPRDAAPSRPDGRSVSILKSGVIDGMAYTLYTDGSIEAQLPQGLMRFASIEDLRAHLENQG